MRALGGEVLNDVVFTQVCTAWGSDEQTLAVGERLMADGDTWMTGSLWHGRRVLRIAVSNQATGPADVERALAALGRAVVGPGPGPGPGSGEVGGHRGRADGHGVGHFDELGVGVPDRAGAGAAGREVLAQDDGEVVLGGLALLGHDAVLVVGALHRHDVRPSGPRTVR